VECSPVRLLRTKKVSGAASLSLAGSLYGAHQLFTR
jgi:hypothetical protein